jgi:hypothetical protein
MFLPFNAIVISGCFQYLSNGRGAERHAFAFKNCMGHTANYF